VQEMPVEKEISSNQKILHLGMRIYNGFMAFIYLCAICLMAFAFILPFMEDSSSMRDGEMFFYLGVMAVFVVFIMLFLAFYVFLAVSVHVRTKWNFVLQVIGLAMGMTSFLTMLPAVLLLVFWVMDENRKYYWDN
jgi:hypothetical protein